MRTTAITNPITKSNKSKAHQYNS